MPQNPAVKQMYELLDPYKGQGEGSIPQNIKDQAYDLVKEIYTPEQFDTICINIEISEPDQE
jgi:hypothetical protein